MKHVSSSTAFFWGTALGVFVALGLVLGNDLGLDLWPVNGTAASTAEAAPGKSVPLFLAGVPLGYTVHVDGGDSDAEFKNAGISLFVSEGPHTISLRGPEGVVWTGRISASLPDTLAPQFGGEIAVDVLPQARGGRVFLDGNPTGVAPGSLGSVTPGWHWVSVRSGDDLIYEETCFVRSGDVTVVSVPPAPPQGRAQLQVRSRILTEIGFQPLQGSTVFVDGENRGKVPVSLDLPRGFHSVRVEHHTQETVVEVLYLPAGQTRQVLADFGREDRLRVNALAPEALPAGRPAAIPVTVDFHGEPEGLEEANVLLVREQQSQPVSIPLSMVRNESNTWLAYIPAELMGPGVMRGYAACRDALGRSGQSELFTVNVR